MTDRQPEMARLDAMVGEWDVTFEARNSSYSRRRA